MANQIGRQTPDFLKFGKAKMYARKLNDDGTPQSPFKDVGNVESASVSVENETTDYTTNEDDNLLPIRSISRLSAATLAFVARNHNPIVNALSLLSDEFEFEQAAVPAGTFEDEDGEYAAESIIILNHQNITAVSSITNFAEDVTLLVDEHYKVDADAGIIKIIGLPDGEEVLEGIKIAYTAGAYTTKTYGGFSRPNGILCEVAFRETSSGPKGVYTFHKVRISPDGEQGIIADGNDPLTRSFTCSIEADETKPINFGLFEYRKLKGSL